MHPITSYKQGLRYSYDCEAHTLKTPAFVSLTNLWVNAAWASCEDLFGVCWRMRADLLFCFLFLRPVLCVCARLWLPVVGSCLPWCLWLLWLPLPGQYFYFQEVLPVLAAKHCMMQATAELHQSTLANQKKKFGEEIARLQVCLSTGDRLCVFCLFVFFICELH